MAVFEEVIDKVLKHEGGYVNDPTDRGGETYRGITRKNFPGWLGWRAIDKIKPEPKQVVPELEPAVKQFYKTKIWDKLRADEISDQDTANALFDWTINSGSIAIKKVQRLLGLISDGIIGPITIKAINESMELSEKIKTSRIAFLKNIVEKTPSQRKYLKGWIARANSF